MKISGESQAELIKYALIGLVGYFLYQSVTSKVINLVDSLNPFSADGFIGKLPVDPSVDPVKIKSKNDYFASAMAQAGKDIKYYGVWMNNGFMGDMPPGTMKVMYEGKAYYFAPKSAFENFITGN